jgi:hypothetical protein
MSVAEREYLITSGLQAFDPAFLRSIVLDVLLSDAPGGTVAVWIEAYSGAPSEVAALEAQFDPGGVSIEDWLAEEGELPEDRLRLVGSLVEARGEGDAGLIVEEALRRSAHAFIIRLGGTLPPFEPISDETFDSAYRQRTSTLAVGAFRRLGGASDEQLAGAVRAYATESGRWWVDGTIQALLQAIAIGGDRLFYLLRG